MFKNLKIKTLVILALGVLTALVLVIGGLGIYGTKHTVDQLQSIALKDVKAAAIVEKIRFKMEVNRSQILQTLQHNPVTDWAKLHDHPIDVHFKVINDTTSEINDIWARYMAGIATADERKLADDWHARSGKLGIDGISAAADAIRAGKWDDSEMVLIKTINPTYRVADGALKELTDSMGQRAQANSAQVEADIAGMFYFMLGVAAAGALLAVAIGFFLVRSITVPLDQAIAIARRVAEGDLTGDIEVSSTNEIGQLLRALKDMNASLTGIVQNVRVATDMIGTASSQIATGNLDLSSRTEQQAGSLEETASSMEELTGTVKQNGDNARQANQLALSAAEVAVRGGAVVSEVVTTMGSINESARKIVDIISVIDGIAFQTNILALNAAVEAARAGEQGRGFAVVATEVRNLAQRSAGAAKEIKMLIGDSVEKVGVGAKLVDQAGATMNEIVDSVKRVTDIMGEIASASQEQSAGIEQVNQAVAQMDQMTQQNATLVEEAAAAAESLEGQAQNLVQVVSVFKLVEMPAAAQAPSPSARVVDMRRSAINLTQAKTARHVPLADKPRLTAIAS
ncbi:HAMP domain-containing protein [Noviherbaspirillum cavernae]|uniref:HAMP domain-containing protein n=1 Tax=Noviherbaspirillum cavernae TaxID=2320862 RepID=A0A418X4P9_9BURK|nr:methyl-accepting chemotaxis protein [Noviherbaspirillum cavernae]RJG07415.1 HAMP domain-containing protein [Noviherbaspirillum cavernae]